MADFNVSLSGPQAAGAGVIAPVRKADVGSSGALINLAGDMAKIFMVNQQEDKKKKAEEFEARIIGDFTREQAALNEAMMTGQMTQAQASARARVNFSKYSANYPQFVESFAKQNKALVDHSAIGEAMESEQSVQDRERQLLSDMQKSGIYMPDNASAEFKTLQVDAYLTRKRLDEEFQRTAARNAETRAMSSEERQQYQFSRKQNVAKGLVQIGGSYIESAQAFSRDVLDRIRSGEDSAVVIADINTYFGNIQAGISSLSAEMPEMGGIWNNMFDKLRVTAMDVASGKIDKETLENELTRIKNQSQITALSDPQMQGLYAASALLNGQLPALFYQKNQAALDAVMRVSQGFGGVKPQIVGIPENEEAAFSLLKSQVAQLESGRVPDMTRTKEQITNVVNNVLDQVGNASENVDGKALNAAASFLASPEYAKIIQYGLVDAATASKAKDVFQTVYEREIVKGIDDKLGQPFSFGGGTQQATVGELLDFKFTGSGVTVEPTQAPYMNQFTRQNRNQLVREMKTAVKMLNQTIHMGAHMEGGTDYAKYWEENRHNLLPSKFDAPVENKQSYGKRADGTEKGSGYFGELKVPGTNNVATEYSIGVNINGREVEIPTLVPTLSQSEKSKLLDVIRTGEPIPENIINKAVNHARERISKGESPFANSGKQSKPAAKQPAGDDWFMRID